MSSIFIVSHTGPTGDKFTAHKTLAHARDSVRKRHRKPYRPATGAVIYEINTDDLREVETHGRVEEHVEGQEPLF